MHRKPCGEIESEFDVWIWKVHSLSIPSDRWAFERVKTAVKFKNLKIVVICEKPLLLAYLITIEKVSAIIFTNF